MYIVKCVNKLMSSVFWNKMYMTPGINALKVILKRSLLFMTYNLGFKTNSDVFSTIF